MPVLPRLHARVRRQAVLSKNNLPVRPQDSSHLTEGLDRIGN